jgi:hypothetical protein
MPVIDDIDAGIKALVTDARIMRHSSQPSMRGAAAEIVAKPILDGLGHGTGGWIMAHESDVYIITCPAPRHWVSRISPTNCPGRKRYAIGAQEDGMPTPMQKKIRMTRHLPQICLKIEGTGISMD